LIINGNVERKKKATYAEETLPRSIKEKETLAQKSLESPLPQTAKIESANGDLEGKRNHLAPEAGCEKHYSYQ